MNNVLDFLDLSAESHPDKTALFDDFASVTFSGLRSIASTIGTSLSRLIDGVNKPIIVFIDRNVESICCFLGVVASRNFYVPVDVNQPVERIRTILGQVQPAAVISVHNNIPKDLMGTIEITMCEYDELIRGDIDDALLETLRSECLDTDPLYAICTSGSTGVPKAVLISHRSVIDFIPVFAETFGFDNSEVFGNQAPFDFDVSVKDIYTTLFCGASLYVIPRSCFVMPKSLVTRMEEHGITSIIWAVSALCVVDRFKTLDHLRPSHLTKILFSGEAMPVKVLNSWRAHYPEAMFVNLYGPTEITCNCMYYIVDRDFDGAERLPLGIPFKNERVIVLGENNKPIHTGELGEICVMGTCLALGYWNNPERTTAAFVQNPLNTSYPETMYRTGDLAELTERGEYVYRSRKDFQIKHMGHRIELEEIEAHLNACDMVVRACCLFDEERNKIVAYYEGTDDVRGIALELGKVLPKYMVPNVFQHMDSLPISKNGKIDRQLLRKTRLESRD